MGLVEKTVRASALAVLLALLPVFLWVHTSFEPPFFRTPKLSGTRETGLVFEGNRLAVSRTTSPTVRTK